MHKIIFFCFLLLSSVWGYDFSYCQQRYQEIAFKFNKTLNAIPIFYNNQTYYIMHSTQPIYDKRIIKSDPFIGMYLLQSPKSVKGYLLRDIDSVALDLELSAVSFDYKEKVRIVQKQMGFLDFAKLDKKIDGPSRVVSNICYQIYGITTQKGGFITKPYIERFLSQKQAYYGDIGVRLKGNSVWQIDPFFKYNPFLPNDKILKIKETTILKNVNLEWLISNLQLGKSVDVVVERVENGKKITKNLKVTTNQRYGGFLLMDTFLESQGVKINSQLEITKTNDGLNNGLEKLNNGDRILWIGKIDPMDLDGDLFENVRNLIMNAYLKEGFIEFLIDRNGFQFYIKVYPK